MTHKGRLDRATINGLAEKAGVDIAKMQKDIEGKEVAKQLDANMSLAQEVMVDAFPTFVVGEQIFKGALREQEILDAIATARKAKK